MVILRQSHVHSRKSLYLNMRMQPICRGEFQRYATMHGDLHPSALTFESRSCESVSKESRGNDKTRLLHYQKALPD
jgi:hypothetical protein